MRFALLITISMAGACCPSPGEPGKPTDAGDAGSRVDAGPDAGTESNPCAACPDGLKVSFICDGGPCPSSPCDAGVGLEVVSGLNGFRLNCFQAFNFDIEAQCGQPVYTWTVLDGGFPSGAAFWGNYDLSSNALLQGVIFGCGATSAEVQVTDSAGHRVVASIVFQ